MTATTTKTEFPALGIGTWAWGDKLFWNYGQPDDAQQVRAAFFKSLESGITFFDTAEIYGLGESERLIGKFLKESGSQSAHIQIATKYMPAPWRFSAQVVRDAIAASLSRLQVDRVALYQVHQPFSFLMSPKTLMHTLAEEVQKGRIEAIGVSNYSASQMREAQAYLAEKGVTLAVNQVRYSLLDRQIEKNGILAAAREMGVTILAYSPLAQGLLTGKYTKDSDRPTGARRINKRFSPEGLAKIEPLLQLLKELAAKYNRTPAQVALNWLIAQSIQNCKVIPIPGAKTANQAEQNAGALGWSLSPEEIEQLRQVSDR
jgi:aryl-alcohol dehydrogenase-like predicted oxidoreductase